MEKEHLKSSIKMSLKDKSFQKRFHIPCDFPDEMLNQMIDESIDDYWKENNINGRNSKAAIKCDVNNCEKYLEKARQKINLEKENQELRQKLIDAGLVKPAIYTDVSRNA